MISGVINFLFGLCMLQGLPLVELSLPGTPENMHFSIHSFMQSLTHQIVQQTSYLQDTDATTVLKKQNKSLFLTIQIIRVQMQIYWRWPLGFLGLSARCHAWHSTHKQTPQQPCKMHPCLSRTRETEAQDGGATCPKSHSDHADSKHLSDRGFAAGCYLTFSLKCLARYRGLSLHLILISTAGPLELERKVGLRGGM